MSTPLARRRVTKEIAIGNELYASSGDFDPRLSAVVRVDATRLRNKLREYYDTEGSSDPLLIDLPKGTYTPVFRSGGSQPVQSESGVASRTEPSIAVLPFSNLSPEPGDYFSDGLTEEIIHALSSVRGMRVVARTSCFALKHRNADVREVGRTLDVDYVLEGSVRKSVNALRVTVRLVSTNDGYQLWSRRYDKQIDECSPSRTKLLARSWACCGPGCELYVRQAAAKPTLTRIPGIFGAGFT